MLYKFYAPLLAALAIGAFNAALRWAFGALTPEGHAALEKTSPRVAHFITVLESLGLNPQTLARGIAGLLGMVAKTQPESILANALLTVASHMDAREVVGMSRVMDDGRTVRAYVDPVTPSAKPPASTFVAGTLALMLCLSSCAPPAVTPQTAETLIVTVAGAVHVLAETCAVAATEIGRTDKARALAILHACETGYADARAALLLSETAVNGWAQAGAQARYACALASAVATVQTGAGSLAAAGVKLPSSLTSALAYAPLVAQIAGCETDAGKEGGTL